MSGGGAFGSFAFGVSSFGGPGIVQVQPTTPTAPNGCGDIAIIWDTARGRGDWGVTSGDLAIDPGGLKTAVLLSLFTDRRASADYVPPAGSSPDLHGWWGDTYDGFLLGSRLWQLNRAVKSNATAMLNEAKDMCLEALQWLVDSSVVATITVATTWLQPDALGIQIVLTEPGGLPQTMEFNWPWQGA